MTEFVITDQSGQMKAVEMIRGLDLKKKWRVEIKRHVNKRSLSQNALYHRWIDIISEYTGYEHDEIHDFFKAKFLPPVIIEVGGDRHVSRTTTKLTTSEMTNYMDRVYRFSVADIGVTLPLPDDDRVTA